MSVLPLDFKYEADRERFEAIVANYVAANPEVKNGIRGAAQVRARVVLIALNELGAPTGRPANGGDRGVRA